MKSEKEYFRDACFADDLQLFYKEWVKESKSRSQFFDSIMSGLTYKKYQIAARKGEIELIHKQWIPSNKCCESRQILTRENIAIKVGYWIPYVWKPIHKDLLVKAKKEEAFECQKIDCSCSDCKDFNRKDSWCMKFDKKTIANANLHHPENQECFTHRLN